MPLLIDRKDEQRFFGMFVGHHHSGKTVAEVSYPKPLEVEDFDGRIGGANVPFLDLKGISYNYWPPKQANLIGKLNEKLEQMLATATLQMPGGIVQLPKTHVTDSVTNQCFAFIAQSMGLTHMREDENGRKRKAGRWIGPIQMAGPEDYNLESQGMNDYIAFLKSLPIPNVILSAHLTDVYGFQKEDPDDPESKDLVYAPKVVVGEKLSIRDKVGENIQTHFDHVFKFERETVNNKDRFLVTFRGGIACTSYNWLPYGRHDWTEKNFYEFMMSFKPKAEATNVAIENKK